MGGRQRLYIVCQRKDGGQAEVIQSVRGRMGGRQRLYSLSEEGWGAGRGYIACQRKDGGQAEVI